MHIQVITGAAGTGKTEELIRRIKKRFLGDVILLAPTHSAVNNIRKRCKLHSIDVQSETIYSYLRIDWERNVVIGAVKYKPYVYIDEYSLIRKELMVQIIGKLSKGGVEELTISGDIAQLPPIYEEERYISFTDLSRYDGVPSFIIKHDYESVLSIESIRKADHLTLTTNHRSEMHIQQVINSLFYQLDTSVIKLSSFQEVVSCLRSGFTFISSRYDAQESLYVALKPFMTTDSIMLQLPPFEELHLVVGETYIVSNETDEAKNGYRLRYERSDGEDALFMTEEGNLLRIPLDGRRTMKVKGIKETAVHLLPSQLLSIHKSQGYGIDKVVVCLDDLFDVSMLYTACTRAISDLRFYSCRPVEDVKKELDGYLKRFHELLTFYGYVECEPERRTTECEPSKRHKSSESD